MAKNILLFVLSPFQGKIQSRTYHDVTGRFSATCTHTNETAVRYLQWELQQRGEKLDKVFAFVTQTVRDNGDEAKFRKLLSPIGAGFQEVELDKNGDLSGAYDSLGVMYEKLQAYMEDNEPEQVVVHTDMTGGPRHATMLLMALVRMLQYSGAKAGQTLYTNLQAQMVEEAADLADVTTLLSGAEEFVKYGNVTQLSEYFTKVPNGEKSLALQFLLAAMDGFSETIKVCGKFEYVQQDLQRLSKAVIDYKEFLKQHKSRIGRQEKFFCRLLPTIETTYQPLWDCGEEKIAQIAIIRWCAEHEFLHQAVTFYSEWVPVYLFDSGKLKLHVTDIQETCRSAAPDYSNWQTYLLRYFKPPQHSITKTVPSVPKKAAATTPQNEMELIKSISKDFRNTDTLDQVLEVYGLLPNPTIKLLKALQEFCVESQQGDFVTTIMGLKPSHICRRILQEGMPETATNFKAFLQKRASNESDWQRIFFKAYCGLGHEKRQLLALQFCGLPVTELTEHTPKDAPKSVAHERRKTAARKMTQQDTYTSRYKVLKTMFEMGYLTSSLKTPDPAAALAEYCKYVKVWRNPFSHATAHGEGRLGNAVIRQGILESLEKLV